MLFILFQNYHLERLHELRMHLVNESWTPCPVKESFSVFQLQEFFGIQSTTHQETANSSPYMDSSCWDGKVCPFELDNLDLLPGQEDLFAEHVKNDSSSEDELKRDFVEEGDFVASTPSSKKYGRLKPSVVSASSSAAPPPPVITTTSLMVLRLCGKYLRVMQMLQTISEDVFNAVTQLVEYYFINVYHMFASDLKSESHHTVPSYKLTSLVKRVNQFMIKAKPLPSSESGISLNKTSINNFLNDLNKSNSLTAAVANNSVAAEVNDDNIATGSSDGHTCMNLEVAELNPSVDLNCPETLHGFRERYIAAESLTYIVSQLKSLKPYMTKAMSLEGAAIVEDYFTQVNCCCIIL